MPSKVPTIPEIDRTMQFRASAMAPASVNEEARTVDVVAATESPTLVPDWERMEMVNEVLLMRGLDLPKSGRVPLLDSHQRYTSENVIGSVSELTVDGDKLTGRAEFSSTADGVYTRVREGHLTDLSVGYRVMQKRFISKGEIQDVNGKRYVGPLNVVTKWKVREISVTPIGADEQAKIRGLSEIPQLGGEEPVNDKVRAALVAAGMPADYTDEQAADFAAELAKRATTTAPPANGDSGVDIAKAIEDAISKREEALAAKRREFRKQVEAACEKRGLSDHIDDLCRSCETMEEVGERMLDILAKRTPSISPRFFAGPSEQDKRLGAIRDGLMTRALGAHYDKEVEPSKRADGWHNYRYSSLSDLARECAEMEGYDVRGLSKQDIATVALGFGRSIGIRSSSYGYHTPGMFPQLLADVGNKSLLKGYMEVPVTWSTVFRQASSVPDFKTIKRIRLSEAQNLDVWAGINAPNEVGLTDEQETYAVECYSMAASISYKTLVNDDLDALTRVPQLLGQSANRTVNAHAWSQITANGLMNDGVALFSTATGNRKKTNVGTGAISATSLGTGRAVMRLQVGSNDPDGNASQAILNIEPKYLVVPAEIEHAAKQVCFSQYDPTQLVPAGSYNPNYGVLIPVVEPLLSATSATQWYLFADANMWDTVEVTFLEGQERPVTRTETDFNTLSQKIIILQTFGAKAIDHRGCYRSTGA